MTQSTKDPPWYMRPFHWAVLQGSRPRQHLTFALYMIGTALDFRYHGWWVESTLKRYVLWRRLLTMLHLVNYIGPWKKKLKNPVGPP